MLYTPEYCYLQGFLLDEMAFDAEQTCATLFGYRLLPDGETYCRCDVVAEFDLIADILLQAGFKGDQVLEQLSKKLTEPIYEPPATLDIEDLLGEQLAIPGMVLKAYKPYVQQRDGQFRKSEGEDYFLEALIPVKDFHRLQMQELAEQQLERLYDQLDAAYTNYRNYRKQGLSKTKARERTGICDEWLFALVALRHRINGV